MPTVVGIAHDDRFFYFAARCKKAPGAVYPTSRGPRPRDPELDRQDRLDLLVDVNRDYTSYWRLTVDHRGWTSEMCLNDSSWNPTWYVASTSDDAHWYVEAAIPLVELVLQPPKPNDAWLLGIQRTIPAVGFQSWTRPASPQGVRPEGFGYLVFD